MFERMRRSGGKAFAWGLAACLLIACLLCGGRYYARTHFQVDGARYTLVRRTGEEAVLRDTQGEEAVLTGSRDLPLSGGIQVMSYAGKEASRAFDVSDVSYYYTLSDGTTWSEQELEEGASMLSGEYRLMKRLCALYEGRAPLRQAVRSLLLSCLLLLGGLFLLCLPGRAWEISHFLTVEGGEPTELALFAAQFSGVLLAVVGLVFAVM